MVDIDQYLKDLISACRSVFSKRLLYIGLQGSYLRGEANENSDIDIMLIIDRFSVEDMDVYRSILMKIGHFEKSCGFVCGKDGHGKMESSGSLSAEAYDEGPVRMPVRSSSFRVQTG